MNHVELSYSVDLTSSVQMPVNLGICAVAEDQLGHTIKLHLTEGGKALTGFSGSGTIYFRRADGETVQKVSTSATSDGTITFDFPASAYAVVGQVKFIVRVHTGSIWYTALEGYYTVGDSVDGSADATVQRMTASELETLGQSLSGYATRITALETAMPMKADSDSVDELKDDLANAPYYRIIYGYNIFDKESVSADTTLNPSNGSITTLANYSTSNYISVESETKYTRNATESGTIQCFYDKDKTFISSLAFNKTATFETPNNARYMRISISSTASVVSYLMITEGENISDVYTPYKSPFIKYGKYAETSKLKVACLGDSITWGYNDNTNEQVAVPYPSVLKREYGFKEVVNLGVSGTTVGGDAQVHDGHQIGSQQNFLTRVNTIPSDTDIICIFGGTNDFGVESYYVPLGSINDTTNLTFYGSLRLLFNSIISNHLGAKIYYITPIHRQTESKSDNGVSRELKQYVSAIKEICRYYGVEIIDLYLDGEFYAMNSGFRAKYTASGLHPNQEWYYLLGRKIGDRLISHLN